MANRRSSTCRFLTNFKRAARIRLYNKSHYYSYNARGLQILPKPFCLAQSDVQAATRYYAGGSRTAKIYPSNQEVEQPPYRWLEKNQLRKLEIQDTRKRKSRKTELANKIALKEYSLWMRDTPWRCMEPNYSI
jgi:hypothetical protein